MPPGGVAAVIGRRGVSGRPSLRSWSAASGIFQCGARNAILRRRLVLNSGARHGPCPTGPQLATVRGAAAGGRGSALLRVGGEFSRGTGSHRPYREPIIPTLRTRPLRNKSRASSPRPLCRGRTRIEQAVNKLKRFKRVALGCEKTKRNFASIGALTAGFSIWSNPSRLGILRR